METVIYNQLKVTAIKFFSLHKATFIDFVGGAEITWVSLEQFEEATTMLRWLTTDCPVILILCDKAFEICFFLQNVIFSFAVLLSYLAMLDVDLCLVTAIHSSSLNPFRFRVVTTVDLMQWLVYTWCSSALFDMFYIISFRVFFQVAPFHSTSFLHSIWPCTLGKEC